ncbi:hypothetical protein CcCBS67573_g05360 [Chytriomyces confervae]|uniref:Uncharacterized protein n=1 Tax=Chytriomyces confervae TaxID=246404 RepID=A0A507FB03_9FUNG|nr:hypothetical protein HDU80_009149 [Chytriomyces hyalinus]TPX73374.1 hypothetical protein CcCBS67573_g05360 [Chytriomyces confervae]
MSYNALPSSDSDADSVDYSTNNNKSTASIPLQKLSIAIPKTSDMSPEISNTATTTNNLKITTPVSLLEITDGRLIQLVGLPPDTQEANPEEEDSPCLRDVRDIELPIKPPMVTMGVDDKGRPIVDVIDSMDEDPFTLDSYEKMIRMHAAKGKDFLLARVTTVDPQDETRFYYSYYSAHHINKVLFRTQPEEGLLHRMKAKNPLNNMVIIGDVHYYVIKALSVNVAIATNRTAHPVSVASSVAQDQNKNIPSPISAEDQILIAIAERLSGKVHRFLKLTGIESSSTSRRLRLMMKPDGLVSSPKAVQRIDGEASLERQNTLEELGADPGTHNSDSSTVLAQLDKFIDFLKGSQDESALPVDYCNDFEVLFTRYQSDINGRNSSQRMLRVSSFVNDFGRNKVLSFEEWLQSFQVENIRQPNNNDCDVDTHHHNGPLKQRKNSSPSTTVIKMDSPASSTPQKLYYLAEYLASDDDFLMKSSVRAIFRENALESDDAVLFTLLSSSSSEDSPRIGEQHPALRNFAYAFESSSGWSVSGKAFRMFLFVYGATSVIVVNFFVPDAYFYIASFSFLFFLCLFFIIVL